MNSQPESQPSGEEDLRAENEVLKLKLEMEHGMKGFASMLNPKDENQWLKSIYDFEVMLKDAKGITVHELIGRPPVKPWSEVKIENMAVELRKLLDTLAKNGIGLQNVEGADDFTFYRAITEELLPMKLSDFSKGPFMPPLITWFRDEK